MEKSAKCGPIWDGSSNRERLQKQRFGLQNGSQSDDLGVPGRSGRGPRAPKPNENGLPEGSGRGPGASSHEVRYGVDVPRKIWLILGPSWGGVLGPMLDHFGDIFVSFFWSVLDIASGPLLGAILSPTWAPNGVQNPPGKALETKPDAKQRKC